MAWSCCKQRDVPTSLDMTTYKTSILLLLAVISCGQHKYSWEEDLQYRLATDFCRTRQEVKEYIVKYIPDVTEQQIDAWTASGKLEAMEIDGKTMYFRNAGPNLFRIDKACKAIKDAAGADDSAQYTLSGNAMGGDEKADMINLPEILETADLSGGSTIAAPKRMRVKYTVTVDADAVPDGETVRCWLPYPRSDVARQTDVQFIRAGAKASSDHKFFTETTDSELITFAPKEYAHSTLYMEIPACKGQPVTFTEEFEYTSAGEYFRDLENRVKPYDKESAIYKAFTAEREKHIIFTPRIKEIADSLTAGIENPFLQAKAIFTWIDANFPWASAREYSTLENIPEYVLANGHGDCGQVTLTFLTMCRYKGIPGHFQSGFMMHPDAWNLHDWAELYFEGVGWVPVDQSFGRPVYATGEYLQKYPLSDYFFLGGIDSWRMIVNQDFGMELYPAKIFPRSETVDFQRGEVEWKGGNLYFPKWDYDMEITYL